MATRFTLSLRLGQIASPDWGRVQRAEGSEISYYRLVADSTYVWSTLEFHDDGGSTSHHEFKGGWMHKWRKPSADAEFCASQTSSVSSDGETPWHSTSCALEDDDDASKCCGITSCSASPSVRRRPAAPTKHQQSRHSLAQLIRRAAEKDRGLACNWFRV